MRRSYTDVLSSSQQAACFLETRGSLNTSMPIPFISSAESSEMWTKYESLMLACLETGDDKAAHQCLEKLIHRFGASNERLMGLRGIYQEAVAENHLTLENILKEYDDIRANNPVNASVMKRRAALLRQLSRPSDAINALNELLEISPTDIEAWAELSDLYLSQGLFSQAEFCLEEVLLVSPNAWNIHARLGELLYLSVMNCHDYYTAKVLAESIRRFCRSIELCEGFLRGYYGLKIASDRLLQVLYSTSKPAPPPTTDLAGDEPIIQSKETLRMLSERATFNLALIIRQGQDHTYADAELCAAKRLLTTSA